MLSESLKVQEAWIFKSDLINPQGLVGLKMQKITWVKTKNGSANGDVVAWLHVC